jgi:phosphopantothenoylcysteine decarboxylase/phosphopantothenate--cysteine ligase
MIQGKTIVIGVTGGIAAYKACDLVSKLVQGGADVHVIMTRHATEFVGPMTFQTLSGHKVVVDLYDQITEFDVHHVSVSDAADCFAIVPATANIIAKVACGIADDALSTTIVAANCPLVFAPAMNTRMWENPITQANIARLRELGHRFVQPERGWLACREEGRGRLAPVTDILAHIEAAASGRVEDLLGLRVLVTAGPTHEHFDPVRLLSNPSTGEMGFALAHAAVTRGADVTLVTGPTLLAAPTAAQCLRVRTAAEMHEAVMGLVDWADVLIGAAAVSDYAPRQTAGEKLKKERAPTLTVELARTPDVLGSFSRARRPGQTVVGFAAETEDVVANAEAKLRDKGLDLVVANDVTQPGAGFGGETNSVTIVRRTGEAVALGRLSKREVAQRVLDEVVLVRELAEVPVRLEP